ncbi:ABC transporter permease [Streptomyces sp. NPDC059517]|uniref:ABC transporter permease n=1 Tax=Streptomyces sp. NPDC059517 TaxID=3346855 RepID=UPI003676AFE3
MRTSIEVLRAFLWKEAVVLRTDRMVLPYLVAFPLIMAALLSSAFGKIPGVGNGANQAVPGFAVMFAFYGITFLGISHYREHGWGVWTVVRASGLPRPLLLCGVVLPYFVLGVVQFAITLTIGWAAYGMQVTGSVAAFALTVLSTELAIIGVAVVLLNVTSHMSSMQQANHVVVLVGAAASGALLPYQTMPTAVQVLAHATPQFWALQAMKGICSRHLGVAGVLPDVAVLLGMGAVLLTIGVSAFDPARSRRIALR